MNQAKIKCLIKRTVCSRPGRLSRLLRYPNPRRALYRENHLDLGREKGLGDVLLCTPALREVKRLNPSCRIRFFTGFGQLISGLPYLDEVHPIRMAPSNVITLAYEGCTPPQGHLARIIGDQLGVDVKDVRPDCIVDQTLVNGYRLFLNDLPRPHVLVLRRASQWTPNKDWPNDYWDIVAEEMSRIGTSIEIGQTTGHIPGNPSSYIDLRGKTSIDQLAAIVAAADLYIGPVSGPMHIAAAVGTPAVVIYGGYENPIGYEGYEQFADVPYRTQISLYSPVPCAPCWRTDRCPFNTKCLSMIEPNRVIAAALEVLKGTTRAAM